MTARLVRDPDNKHPNAGVEHWSSDTPLPPADARGPAATAARRAVLRDAAPFIGELHLAEMAELSWVRRPGARLRPGQELSFEQMGRSRQRRGMYVLASLIAKDPKEGAADAAQGIDRFLAFRRSEDRTTQTVVATRRQVQREAFRLVDGRLTGEDGSPRKYERAAATGPVDPVDEVWEGSVRLFQPEDEERFGVGYPQRNERAWDYRVRSHPKEREALENDQMNTMTPLACAATGIDRRVGDLVHQHLWRVYDGKEALHPLVTQAREAASPSVAVEASPGISAAFEAVNAAQQPVTQQPSAPVLVTPQRQGFSVR